jgi:prepilin-type N-terminal cleavage/methylation domain-containing protein
MASRTKTADRRPVRPAARCSARRAFTLIELMVSIALVLIIILGVNAVFKMASDTVNAGMALSAADRDNRAIQSVLYNDIQTAVVSNGPMLLIRSERVSAFRNRADQEADRDPTSNDPALTIDLDNNNQEGEAAVKGERIMPAVYNSRNHRVDRMGFFANHLFRRQTGIDGTTTTRFLDEATSNEAYIWYGHLRQPSPKPLGTTPGRFVHPNPGDRHTTADPNPNNFYATDWILGRVVTLLRELPPPNQNYIVDAPPTSSSGPDLAPLSPRSKTKEATRGSVREDFTWSTCDLAQTSINGFRTKLSNYHAAWEAGGPDAPELPWWDNLGSERFQGYPYPDRPLTAYGLARTNPVFVRGCTQFIVEYAGDYLAQKVDTGEVVGTYLGGAEGTDGIVDFVMVPQRAPDGTLETTRRIRWYGMPRNVDTSDDPNNGTMIVGAAGASGDYNRLRDVVPLRDILLTASNSSSLPPEVAVRFFEKFYNLDVKANYGAVDGITTTALARYYAAWGPTDLSKGSLARPKMLRITLTVDEPNGRLTEGQTYEYVIDLP